MYKGDELMEGFSRRNFLAGAGSIAAACAAKPLFAMASKSPFRIAVISDEISPDFDHACSVISKDFGLQWVELRSMWGKTVHDLSDAQLADAQKILAKYSLRVTDMGSPLFKVDWPGAPKSSHGSKHDFGAEETFKQQNDLLTKYIALAKRFKTDKIRCFDFWRLDDQKPYRAAIDEKLKEAAATCGKQGIRLVLIQLQILHGVVFWITKDFIDGFAMMKNGGPSCETPRRSALKPVTTHRRKRQGVVGWRIQPSPHVASFLR